MTHAPHPEASRPDNSRWTPGKAKVFLEALAVGGKVAPAARAVGMTRQSAYRLRERAPAFAELWLVALEEAERRKAASGARARRGRGARAPVHPLLAKRAVACKGPPA